MRIPPSGEYFSPKSHFLFIDESGNFDFGSTGSAHFVMAGVLTSDPLRSALPLQALRYRLLEQGINLSSFHASPDLQVVRDSVIQEISTLPDLRAHVVFGDKEQLHPSLKNMQDLHFHFTTALMQFHLDAGHVQDSSQLVVVIDQSLTTRGQAAFNLSIKPIIKKYRKKFHIFFQSMKTDFNGQIADYVAWAKFKQLESDEHRPWQALSRSLTITEQEIKGGKAEDFWI
ncbi:MAG: DUF3800 domain-containing protein [Actinomycetota bacterium]